jgi:hypothetical protein
MNSENSFLGWLFIFKWIILKLDKLYSDAVRIKWRPEPTEKTGPNRTALPVGSLTNKK